MRILSQSAFFCSCQQRNARDSCDLPSAAEPKERDAHLRRGLKELLLQPLKNGCPRHKQVVSSVWEECYSLVRTQYEVILLATHTTLAVVP